MPATSLAPNMTWSGDVNVEQWPSFLSAAPQVQVIEGSLTVGKQITTLASFAQLNEIRGNLNIDNTGMENFSMVGCLVFPHGWVPYVCWASNFEVDDDWNTHVQQAHACRRLASLPPTKPADDAGY